MRREETISKLLQKGKEIILHPEGTVLILDTLDANKQTNCTNFLEQWAQFVTSQQGYDKS